MFLRVLYANRRNCHNVFEYQTFEYFSITEFANVAYLDGDCSLADIALSAGPTAVTRILAVKGRVPTLFTKLISLQSYKLASLQTYKLTFLQAYKLTNFSSYKLTSLLELQPC